MGSDRHEPSEKAPRRPQLLLRLALAVIFVLLVGTLAVRTAVVRAFAEDRPQTAARVWREHPDVLKSLALATVAEAAAHSQEPPPALRSEVAKLSDTAPLAPEPFLIEGSIASRAGDYRRAEALLASAVRRDPRSVAGRFLLADLYLQQDRLGLALDHLTVLARLSPAFTQSLIPALARYAETPGAAPELKRSMNANPQFANELLAALASEPRNAKLVLYLGSGVPWSGEVQPWQQKLVSTLVQAGDYDDAYSLWQRFDKTSPAGNAFAFTEAKYASPFTWTFANGADAAAEPAGGSLRVTFTGNQTSILASKIARLQPGSYIMRWKITGGAQGVAWKISCLPANLVVSDQSLGAAEAGQTTASFTVGDGCKAQRFELTGEAQTIPSPAEFTILDFQVNRVPSHA